MQDPCQGAVKGNVMGEDVPQVVRMAEIRIFRFFDGCGIGGCGHRTNSIAIFTVCHPARDRIGALVTYKRRRNSAEPAIRGSRLPNGASSGRRWPRRT